MKSLTTLSLYIFLAAIFLLIGSSGYGLYKHFTQGQPNLDWTKNGTVTTQPLSLNLDLNSPEDEILVNDKSVLVSGKTLPNASVLITDESKETATTADDKGDFSKVVTLDDGLNHLVITSFDSEGDSKTVNKTIYYSEDKLQ